MNDDLISRRAVLDLIKTYNNSFASIFLCHQAGVDFAKCVKEMPSVTAEQTHEEWCIDCKEYDQEQQCCHRFCKVIREWERVICSECRSVGEDDFNYCPNCGARMVGDDNE